MKGFFFIKLTKIHFLEIDLELKIFKEISSVKWFSEFLRDVPIFFWPKFHHSNLLKNLSLVSLKFFLIFLFSKNSEILEDIFFDLQVLEVSIVFQFSISKTQKKQIRIIFWTFFFHKNVL